MAAVASRLRRLLLISEPLVRLGRVPLRSFSLDPFPDEERTAPENAAVGLGQCQEPDRLSVDQTPVLEIDGDSAALLRHGRTKDFHVVGSDPSTHTQDRHIRLNYAIESEGHCVVALSIGKACAVANR